MSRLTSSHPALKDWGGSGRWAVLQLGPIPLPTTAWQCFPKGWAVLVGITTWSPHPKPKVLHEQSAPCSWVEERSSSTLLPVRNTDILPGQAGGGSEQPGPLGAGTGWAWRSLPTEATLWFHDSAPMPCYFSIYSAHILLEFCPTWHFFHRLWAEITQ